jgi:hypothetical protein
MISERLDQVNESYYQREKKLDQMIHVLAEVVKNIKNVMGQKKTNKNKLFCNHQ